jgi:hypothetical protein
MGGRGMSDVTITKFPVTAPNGKQFRVRIEEIQDRWRNDAIVTLYERRKYFGFRCVHRFRYGDGDGTYDHRNVDFKHVASKAVAHHYLLLADAAQKQREIAKETARKQAAIDAYVAWDGKITEVKRNDRINADEG